MPDVGPVRTLIVVASIAAGSALFLSAANEFSRERIAKNEQERLLARLHEVLDHEIAEEALEPVLVTVEDPARLGTDDPVDVFVMMDDGNARALVFATVAPDGYNAPIDLLVGVSTDGRVSGVRVIDHRETPGLGDGIDIEKSDWIRQFDGRSLGNPTREGWRVDKDDGEFDSLTGATVTPRAIVAAVHRTLLYFEAEHEALLSAATTARSNQGAARE
jgi:electron transport complex protein RnfG